MSETSKRPLYIPYAGPSLLEMPLLNKGSAFTLDERVSFNLLGLLPQNVETIEEQAQRAYAQYAKCATNLDKHIYLRAIQDDNETLFFRLLEEHLEEMLPIIYTPTVGEACEEFSKIYRNHRGLFISYPDRHRMDDILRSATKDKVRVIVVTDGERILGLGDQGIGGMGIPIGKLSLYTACGGISPAYTLPIVLDVGTNNQTLLDDPMYMGWRHPRVSQEEYDEFIGMFMAALQRRWPNVLLQFEDFAQTNAMPLLERYRDQLCCFNDDIQGTASVCVATLLAACKAKGEALKDQTIAFLGAGSAGCGIAEQIVVAMTMEGLSEAEARRRVYMVDRHGLLTTEMQALYDFQQRLAHDPASLSDWDTQARELLDVVRNAKPSVLIGVSGQRGLFSEEVIKTLHAGCAQPLVMPLSNPTSKVEAVPQDILDWTGGEALVATGSPFKPARVGEREVAIAQCNNAYIFPGIGLGVVAANASRVTDKMLMAASNALAQGAPIVKTGKGALLPSLGDIREISKEIAFAVAKQAQEEDVALASSDEVLWDAIERHFWYPRYRAYRRRAF
ncbi:MULTISPECIES: NAD-dependent malic enzyme [Chromohalobacter]|uniref:malate dehydrogenase (oxaloacetate-decarboxylating) n=1 Tax=Chromohalobacter israelensis (strain ATCC BAA-138 / DSM 3043 / CIP 106854 / NCIMB 13768 / 1H11) TaxID=290398 RepID=Q1QTA0_CHRI1|nr:MULTISPECIES: NAD-dependent malic enzyme [Chromohalobacter]ABE60308.1 NAD-dependent malic enzyme [Chromohalobacter salexigens DSM 3043]NQY45273.1 NAD-dependent malic enzyme [Chromohalobacter sp.]NWO56495.1 NAD-dependent malic enzyme [Chromohalobacter salexigens]PWW35365.1 NAD-dependent malic enzyme [Chromohalobacter salexigens]RXE49349.1 NAD-dependent malic enzyme [Chromohalobacter salexigens]